MVEGHDDGEDVSEEAVAADVSHETFTELIIAATRRRLRALIDGKAVLP